ncbi:uncharacterized protein LOC125946796 [Dermacentor silvarum]|uniref:uncharacterized protein LOC125946796 n=1 Tax=Dermacentor silvarum TaxID=543639 RepID=UPI002100E242|nr:uncharacterized protein LOC125946796 [Dermacentor silvarum]
MDLRTAILSIVVYTMVPSAVSSEEVDCSFHDKHLESSIHDFVAKLPAKRLENVDKDEEHAAQLNSSQFKFFGLNSLRPFGPFFTFCPNGSRVVQFDLVNEQPLVVIGPFPGEKGKQHEVESQAILVRFTAQFEVEGTGENVKLHSRVNMPVSMVGLSFRIEGLDEKSDEVVEKIAPSLQPRFFEDWWRGILFSELDILFTEILEKGK